ncbi:DUF1778 domain-containing protein [Neisseria sp. S1]|uniref:type II toxin -antitoxin system TacA 1-like antitoxin n=1 Tax=Neisseria sp. S1 TaxID=3318354 RepID=UPI003A88D0C4
MNDTNVKEKRTYRRFPVLQTVVNNPDELALIKAAAASTDGNVSAFLRRCALEAAKKIMCAS